MAIATVNETGLRSAVTRSAATTQPLYVGVAVLAFFVRLMPLVTAGGLAAYGRYDDGVYYAAADAFSFGRIPYRDFYLLHPPGIMLVLTPFALLGRLTTGPVGMAVARLAFMAIGALNAVLVARLARRWGFAAAVAAGVICACWYSAVTAEQTTLLEPLGTTALLVALLLLLKRATAPTGRDELAAGIVLGLACALKIWYVAPFAMVVAWQLTARRWRSATRLVASGVTALSVVVLPFFLLSGTRMYDMVIRAQLGRQSPALDQRGARLASIAGIKVPFGSHHLAATVATAAVIAVLVVAAVLCLTDRFARVLVATFAVNLLVLLMSPSYFGHYAALIAAPGALMVGVGLTRTGARKRVVALSPRVVMIVLVLVGSGVRIMTMPHGKTFPSAQLSAAAPPGCVTANDPAGLIQMDRLSSDLRDGCRVPVDVMGFRHLFAGSLQRYLYDYLVSGRSFVIVPRPTRQLPTLLAAMRTYPKIADDKHVVLRLGLDVSPPRQ